MKILKHILLGSLILPAFISCEMQEEIKGAKDKEAEGALALNVENKLPQSITKADNTIDLSQYPVSITGTSDKETDVNENYVYKDIQGKSVTLPVGSYTISAKTPGELQKKMSTPYFSGSDDLSIAKDLTVEKKIICNMLNTKIDMVYGTDFTNNFKSWDITIDDGSNSVITYSNDDLNPATIYYYLGEEGAETLTMNVTAVTKDDKTIKMRTELTKSNVVEQYPNDTENFVGGDAIKFNMGVELDGIGNANITIGANVWFENEDEDHAIDITDNVVQPSNPDNSGDDTNAPQLICDAFETGVTFSYSNKNFPSKTEVEITTPAGLTSMKVIIDGGNPGFTSAADDLHFNGEGRELVGDTELEEGLGITMPKEGDKNYVFPITNFYEMMNIYGPTVDADSQTEDGKSVGIDNGPDGKEYHSFKLTVTDANGKTASQELRITITK